MRRNKRIESFFIQNQPVIMRFLLVILLSHNFLSCFSQTENKVLATEQQRFEAMTRKDTAALKNLLSDDLTYIHSNAMSETKSVHIGSIGAGTLVYEKMTREKVSVRRYGKIAITNGTLKVQGILKGNPFELHLLYTAVYKKHRKHWQLLNWQSTKIP